MVQKVAGNLQGLKTGWFSIIIVLSICLIFGTPYKSIASAPGLAARWVVLKNGQDSHGFTPGPLLRLRLQIKCSSPGLHRLNSADFYFDYDSSNLIFSQNPVSGIDFVWADGFNPSNQPIYTLSKVVDFRDNPFKANGHNLMDICIVDTGYTTTGTVLDSGKWIDVVDVLWHIKTPGATAKFTWDMTKSEDILTNIFDSFKKTPINYKEEETWLSPFSVQLRGH